MAPSSGVQTSVAFFALQSSGSLIFESLGFTTTICSDIDCQTPSREPLIYEIGGGA